ncbi:MAG TPA: hypothetical protein VHY37_11410 [Tepidisphaeraceae bacterium]|nr:hypothetical protein [Tepidisphaeraceae bacterium]
MVLAAVAARTDAADVSTGGNVELQVAALNALHDLSLTPEQLRTLRGLVAPVADPTASEPAAKGSDAYQAALKSLRDAIIAGDAQKAADAEQKVDQLRADEHLDVVTTVPITDSARQKSADALKLLTASQIAGYLGDRGDEVPDAAQTIDDAMDDSRGKSDADYAAIRDEAADQVALLMCGLDKTKESDQVRQQVDDLLERAHQLTDAKYKKQHGELDTQARKLVGDLDAFAALRNWMQREMADLLSNPELPAMIDAQLAHPEQ